MILVSLAALAAEEPAAFGAEQWLEFYARLHPVLLHVPIGLTVAAITLELVAAFSPAARGARRWVYGLLAISAVLAASSGWLLGGGDDDSGELVREHRWFGVGAAALAVVVASLDLFGRSRRAGTARCLLALLCAGVIGTAGHHGGMITHGRTFLSAAAPPWLAPYLTEAPSPAVPTREVPAPSDPLPASRSAGAEATSSAAGDIAAEDTVALDTAAATTAAVDTLIQSANPDGAGHGDLELLVTTFRERCFECHNEDKSKGGMRLDELSGWEDGVDRESPDDSELLYRVRLPRDDVEAMPPKGKALDEAAIKALQRWIDDGAPTEELEGLLGEAAEVVEEQAASMDQLRRITGARIEAIAADLLVPADRQRLEVTWRHADAPPTVAQLQALGPVADRVVDLDLARSDVGDAAVRALPALPGLERLHLEGSAVTDAAAPLIVERAPGLRYLNLHSTGLTGAAAAPLGGLRELRRLVLFGTDVDGAAADALVARVPALKVTLDAAPPAVFVSGQPRRILAADASKGRVVLLREIAIGRPEVLWERPIQALHDLQWLGETEGGHGRVLVQESWTRIVEVDTRTNETRWSYDARPAEGERVEIHSFQRLEDGTTMVAESGRGRVVFVDGDGAVVGEFPLTLDRPDPHHDTRLVRPTPSGTFLVAHENDGVVREYDRAGKVVWTFDVPLFERERAPGHGPEAHGDQCFAAVRRADGDTLVTTGNGSSLLCVAPDGEVRWRWGSEELGGVQLAWMTTVQELDNGHLVLGNCHAGPDHPQALEVRPDGLVEWTFKDFERFGNSLSNLLVIDAGR